MRWQEKRAPILTVVLVVAVIVIIAAMVLNRQRSDLAMLESTYQNVNAKRILLQYEQSEKQRELSISETSDYISQRARENGYMMPGEIRFVVKNPEALTDHATLDDVRVATVTATSVGTDETPEAEQTPVAEQEEVTAP